MSSHSQIRIVVGSEQNNKQKLAHFEHGDGAIFTMTSGLRSVRDKTLTYLSESLAEDANGCDRVYKMVNAYGTQLKRVRSEDELSLINSGLSFNSHAILGGRLENDLEPKLFYVYPQGNWIESTPDLPYFIIGRTSYGKPILDRLLNFDTPLRLALALALLAFDATRTSVTDVDVPIDVAVLPIDGRAMILRRFDEAAISESTQWWNASLRESLAAMPKTWMDAMFT